MTEYNFTSPIINSQGHIVEQRAARASLKVVTLTEDLDLELVEVPGGSFRMGSLHGQGYPDEQPQHFVQVASFWMSKAPITQAQWRAVMGAHRGRFTGPDRPVDTITWDQAVHFCDKLSKKAKQRFVLPSEAQWEYACRAGTNTPFAYGPTLTSDLANYNGEFTFYGGPKGIYRHLTTDVGSFPPNAFGLVDLHGNLWEWCADAWHDDYSGAPVDGSVWENGPRAEYRVARGGCWHDTPDVCRSASRIKVRAAEGDEMTGFRIVAFY